MRRTFNVAVSLTKNDYAEFELRPPINMVSGDHGTNILKFTVYDNGLPVDLSGNIAKITCKTPSGNRQQQDMTISTPREGKMEVVLDQRFFAEGGTYLAEVQLYDPDNLKVRATLPRFTYNVDASLLEENRVIANEQFSILQQMVDTVASAEERSIEALDTATRAMNIATQKGDKATEEANRAKNEADRAKNEADRAWAADFAKHVTLDAKIQQKFDFIENKVVQDGLKYLSKISPSTVKRDINVQNSTDDFDIMIIVNEITDIAYSNASIIMGQDYASAKMDMRFQLIGGREYVVGVWVKGIKNIPVLKQVKRPRYIGFKRKNGVYYSYTDTQVLELGYTSEEIYFTNVVFGAKSTEHKGFITPIAYNRELYPEEREYIFSILNNPPSVKELHTTNAEGETSILNLASSEDFVEMSTGRTLREEYMGVLKTMGKEFVSPDGSPVEVNNGIEARVINAEIKGQTVKNLFYDKPSHSSAFNNGVLTLTGTSFSCSFDFSMPTCRINKIKASTQYTFIIEVLESNLSNGNIQFTLGTSKSISSVKNKGVYLSYYTSSEIINNTFEIKIGSPEDRVEGKQIKMRLMLLEGQHTISPVDRVEYGLSSTQAIISNNGQQYPVYEPTIQGKTRILKAPKGTRNWVEISDSEERDTNRFDYKLDSIAGDLGGTPTISDYIDRVKKVKVSHTKELTFDNTFNVTLHSVSGEFTRFRITPKVTDYIKGGALICNSFKYISVNPSIPTEETINNHSVDGYYDFWINTSRASTVELFKTWLQANPVTIRYQLATPTKVPLTEKQLSAYDTYKKLISLGGVGGVYDTLEIKEDGSSIIQEKILKLRLDGTQNYTWYVSAFDNDTSKLYVRTDSLDSIIATNSAYLSDKLNYTTQNISGSMQKELIPNVNTICTAYSTVKIRIVLDVNAITSLTPAGVNDYLRNNNIILNCVLTTPKATDIDKSITPTIRTHNQTNILEVGGAVKAQSFKVTVPVDQIATINAELEAIKAVLNSPSNLLLSAKYVEDEFNKNNKLESEMMN